MKLTWILVANNTQARIFTALSPSSGLEEIEGFTHTESRLHDREITSDLPGKIKSSDGSDHAFEQETDPKQHEAECFAGEITHHLKEAYNTHEFEHLLIIAEPSFLGLLRQHLPEDIKKQVRFELDKNITSHSVAEIRAHLPTYLPNY